MTSSTFPDVADRHRPAAVGPAFWKAPFARSTHREMTFALTGLPIAIVGFCFAVPLFSAGLGLVITALGLPVLALLVSGARGFGALERSRARTLLAMDVAAPAAPVPSRPGFWGFVTARLADAAGWRAVLYQVLMFPWAVFNFCVTLTFLITGWTVALYPLYHWVFARYTPWPGYRLYDFTIDGVRHEYFITSPLQIAAVSVIGFAMVYLTPPLVRALNSVHRVAIKGLLSA